MELINERAAQGLDPVPIGPRLVTMPLVAMHAGAGPRPLPRPYYHAAVALITMPPSVRPYYHAAVTVPLSYHALSYCAAVAMSSVTMP